MKILKFKVDKEALEKLSNGQRNQLFACMHAHNELAALNRIFMFTLNDTSDGELHDSAKSVQMWCILQLLVGKLFETWVMIKEKFSLKEPVDPAILGLEPSHKEAFERIKDYFGVINFKDSVLKHVRDTAAFHYEGLDLHHSLKNMADNEGTIYLAKHPANSLYYLGSALVTRTLFCDIGKKKKTSGLSHNEYVSAGFEAIVEDAKSINYDLHLVLYGFIKHLLEAAQSNALETEDEVINVQGAPDPEIVGLPTLIKIGEQG